MSQIVRTATKATGGITAIEKTALDAHAQLWIGRIMRTDPIEPGKIVPAIEALYATAALKFPRIVIVPSPFVAAFAGGFAAATWYLRGNPEMMAKLSPATLEATRQATDWATRQATDRATRQATDRATLEATRQATRQATDRATLKATDLATRQATRQATLEATLEAPDWATRQATLEAPDWATRQATRQATYWATLEATRQATLEATDLATLEATDLATLEATDRAKADPDLVHFFLACARNWWLIYQGGNMWGQYDCYLSGMRDVIGLCLPEHEKYAAWEQAAIHGGVRIMHPDFCIVSDFPEILRTDAQNRPHCIDGPSHRWRDGWSLYHVHGVRIEDGAWIEDPSLLTTQRIMDERNAEVRRVMVEKIGLDRFFAEAEAEILDVDQDGTGMPRRLLRIDVPDDEPYVVLEVQCPSTGRKYHNPVPPEMRTCLQAVAWRWDLPPEEYLPLMEA